MSTQRPRILIIDDDPLYRSLMTTLLRKDYLLAVAAEGSEGFQKALQHPPDIAVIDIQMPGWDGLKTLEQFRNSPVLKRVKIVMLTGDASKESVVAAIRGGANDYVIKTSFSREEFREKLKRLTSKQINPTADNPTGFAKPANAQLGATVQHVDSGTDPNQAAAPVKNIKSPDLAKETDSEINTDLQTMIDSWE